MSEKNRTITIRLELGRKQLVALLTLGLLALTPGDLVTEQLTLTTYYPSPYGVYEELRATQGTYLSYQGGNTCIGSNSCATKLSVAGSAAISGDHSVGGNAAVTGNSAITGNSTVGGNETVSGEFRVSGAIRRGDGTVIRDANGGWSRTYGNTGWYNGTYGGGWYMQDTSWIRTYGSKNIYHNAGVMRTDGELQVGPSGNRMRVNAGGDLKISGVMEQACTWVNYSVGAQRFCPSGWSAINAASGGGAMTGAYPASGLMFCCRLKQY